DPGHLARQIEEGLDAPVMADPIPGAVLDFDDDSSPWHTIAEIRAPDRIGLLHSQAMAFAAAGADVSAARITTEGSTAIGRFDLNGSVGGKLTQVDKDLIRSFLVSGGSASRGRSTNLVRRLVKGR
ncbi:MAG TPA: hypothetical protein VI193_08620, partial [Acidimicrobiia bacterium]